MSRYTKTQITQLSANEQSAIDSINKNFQDIQEAIADTVSRSGNVPTHMTADFDLNGKRIINTSAPKTDNDFVRRVDVIGDIATVQSLVDATTNAAAQTLKAAADVQEIIQDRNIGLVADDLALGDNSKIKQVSENKDNIDIVAGLDDDIVAVASLKDDIPVVVQTAENIGKVADMAEDITVVANNAANVTSVAENISNINAVNANKTNIDAVNANKTNINAVAGNESDISTVAGISSAVSTVASNASNVSNVATNIDAVNNCADNMDAIQDAPNQAQAAADSAVLSAQYANDKINQTHISNCITHIPQDIKLELNNGTLTLKAGSRVYVPNGAGVFDVLTTSTDANYFFGTATGTYLIFGIRLNFFFKASCTSGATDSLSGNPWHIWYDTTNNKVKVYGDSTVTPKEEESLPIAIATVSNGQVTSIDQVFNGFGYIGSTVFALPGVKGLIPNGRNADGSLKSIEFTVQSVKTLTINSDWGTGIEMFWINETDLSLHKSTLFTFIQDSKPTTTGTTSIWYSPYENIVRRTTDTGSTWTQIYGCYAIKMPFSSGKITSITPKTTFHAVDYNDLNNVLTTLYPVGSIYIGTQNTCPLKTLISGSTWELVATDRALWGGDGTNGNTTIAAGLPNITGNISDMVSNSVNSSTYTGAFKRNSGSNGYGHGGTEYRQGRNDVSFNASWSNSIYGNSSTVQPPAYRVNVWRRTA